MKRISRSVALSLCTALSACQSFLNPTGMDSMTSPSQPAVQTVFLGRFMTDLPAGVTRSGMYKYHFIELDPPVSLSHAEFEAKVHSREDELKKTKHETEPNFLRATVHPQKDTHLFVSWVRTYSTAMLTIDGYRWIDDAGFSLQDEVGGSRQETGLLRAGQLLSRLRPRLETDIPNDPGFCFNGGFIANEKWKYEEVLAGFDFPEHPDLHLSIHFFPLQKSRREKPLIERVSGGLQGLGRLASGVRVLRKEDRVLGMFKGQEFLIAAPNEHGQREHMFTWETQGEGTLETPFITFEMSSGHPDDKGNPQATKLSDEQAMKLWDSIISTFRLRPTSAPPAKVSEAPPLTPLGELAATGRPCPQTGWWQSSEDAQQIQGGTRQFFHAGERLPHAVVLGEPSMWQKLKGEQPSYRVATVWKLVGYEEPAQSPVASTDQTQSGQSNQPDQPAGA